MNTKQWKEARDAATVYLEYGRARGMIAEVEMPRDGKLMLRWAEMPEEKRQALLRPKRAIRAAVEVACELAGTTYKEAQERRVGDTPDARRAARRRIGI